jgi:hypothetical protein
MEPSHERAQHLTGLADVVALGVHHIVQGLVLEADIVAGDTLVREQFHPLLDPKARPR